VRRVVAVLAAASVAALGGACGKNAEPQSGAAVSLTISVVSQEGAAPKTFDITCDPDGGSHPQPKQACAALMEAGPDVFEKPAADQPCTQIYGGPQTATVKGSYEGTEVDAAFSRENGCEIDRWEKLGTTFFDLPLQ